MMKHHELAVWLYGIEIARLKQRRPYRYLLTFTEESRSAFGDGSTAMSLAIPMRGKISDGEFNDRPVSFFIGGLLPEGNVLAALASRLKVSTGEYLPLLGAVGYECAGAVQFLEPGTAPSDGWLEPLSTGEVIKLVEESPTHPVGHEPQASLAGVQDKLLLTKTPEGWAWPRAGAPSTHIIKPDPIENAVLPGLIDAEVWALNVARAAGLAAPMATIETFGSRRALIVERYDRAADGTRIHQEDFAQALSLNPSDKYETTVMESPYRLERLMQRLIPASASPTEARQTLLSQLTFNILIGNGDAHAKNYSVMLLPDGEARLAPLYDVAPTAFMQPRYNKSGLVINGKRELNSINFTDLIAEAGKWGLPPRLARNTVEDVFDAVKAAVRNSALPDDLGGIMASLNNSWERKWLAR